MFKTTMAEKATKGTRTQFATSMANLGSIVRLNSNNFNTISFRFVLDKTLQLIEAPVANPIVKPFSSSLSSNSFEVFHNNLVSIKVGNNLLAYVVVMPSHKPFLSARDFFKQSLGTLSAFGLKFSTNVFEFPFNLLDFMRIKELAVGSDCKVVYSEVNAKNFVLRSIAQSIDFFGKSEKKEASTFSVNSQKAFLNIPSKIFLVAVRNIEWNFNPTFDCSKAQSIILKRCTSWKVISHRCSFDYGFSLGFFDNSASLFDASDSKLTLQSQRTQMFIDKRMEFDVVSDFVLPCNINAELQPFFIDGKSLNYLWSCENLDFSCCNASHTDLEDEILYKSYAQMSSGINASPPTLESVGIRSYEAL